MNRFERLGQLLRRLAAAFKPSDVAWHGAATALALLASLVLAAAFAKGEVRPREFGGTSSTADIVRAVVQRL